MSEFSSYQSCPVGIVEGRLSPDLGDLDLAFHPTAEQFIEGLARIEETDRRVANWSSYHHRVTVTVEGGCFIVYTNMSAPKTAEYISASEELWRGLSYIAKASRQPVWAERSPLERAQALAGIIPSLRLLSVQPESASLLPTMPDQGSVRHDLTGFAQTDGRGVVLVDPSCLPASREAYDVHFPCGAVLIASTWLKVKTLGQKVYGGRLGERLL